MQQIADHWNFNSRWLQFSFWFQNLETIRKKMCWQNFYLFLRFSFLLRLFATLFKEDDEGALAWPVAFRWSKSLFRDGNSLWQVVQLIRTSLWEKINKSKCYYLRAVFCFHVKIKYQTIAKWRSCNKLKSYQDRLNRGSFSLKPL